MHKLLGNVERTERGTGSVWKGPGSDARMNRSARRESPGESISGRKDRMDYRLDACYGATAGKDDDGGVSMRVFRLFGVTRISKISHCFRLFSDSSQT